ncbi:antitoxin [Streptomyces daliensis]|uniref:Antitoxin n=1 Tax=Streptomyces daliensis TaxID=299421 RepID=A0A8T4IQR2_9ACTN|nr:antitoxin [Streptomyces daliensis]
MAMMDKIKQMLKGHEGQASKGVDKAGNMADDKTHGKHSGRIDSAQDKMKDQFGGDQDKGNR